MSRYILLSMPASFLAGKIGVTQDTDCETIGVMDFTESPADVGGDYQSEYEITEGV